MDGTEGALRHGSHNNGCLCGYLAHMVNTLPFNWAWLQLCRQQVRPPLSVGGETHLTATMQPVQRTESLSLHGPAAG